MLGAARLYYVEVLLILFLGFSFQGCDSSSGAKYSASCNKICQIAFGTPPRAALGAQWCSGTGTNVVTDIPKREASSVMFDQCYQCKDKWEESGCVPGEGQTVSTGCEFDFCVMRKLLQMNPGGTGEADKPKWGAALDYSVHPDLHGEVTEDAAAKRAKDRELALKIKAAEPPKPPEPAAPEAPPPPAPAAPAEDLGAATAAGRGAGVAPADTATQAVAPSGHVTPFAAVGSGPVQRPGPAGSLADLGSATKTLAQARVHTA